MGTEDRDRWTAPSHRHWTARRRSGPSRRARAVDKTRRANRRDRDHYVLTRRHPPPPNRIDGAVVVVSYSPGLSSHSDTWSATISTHAGSGARATNQTKGGGKRSIN